MGGPIYPCFLGLKEDIALQSYIALGGARSETETAEESGQIPTETLETA